MSLPLLVALAQEVDRLVPEYLRDPIDFANCQGHGAWAAIGPDGAWCGRGYGPEKERLRGLMVYAQRKASQVWMTSQATGTFEERVYRGEEDEGRYGLMRPDLVGWRGGVPLWTSEGQLVAAAFSGFRGEKDVEIIQRAGEAVGLRLTRP